MARRSHGVPNVLLKDVRLSRRRGDENSVEEFTFEWMPSGATEPLHWRLRSRDHFPILRLFEANIEALRRDYPEAYVLTNARVGHAPAFGVESFLGPVPLANHAHAEVKFDYFYDFSPRSDRLTTVVELGHKDLSPVHDQLLGLVPDPEYWALLLSREPGLCPWVASVPAMEDNGKAWEATLLRRFVAVVIVHEGSFLMIRTKNAELANELT